MATYSKIAALGSSYASGPGIDPIENRAASRSARNYPHLLAESLGATLTDLSVSGATTSTILDQPQRVLFTKFAPQISGLPSDSDLVTITAGGNDLSYIATALKVGVIATADKYLGGFPGRATKASSFSTATPDQLEQARAGLIRIVNQARLRAPQARVLLVDYLPLFGESTRPGVDVPFDAPSLAKLSAVADQLAGVFRDAAAEAGCDLVAASALGRGHELGSSQPWVQPLYPIYRLTGSYHPTVDGMRAVANAIAEQVNAA